MDNKILKDNYDEIKDKFYQNEISIENNQKNVDIEDEINVNNKDLNYSILNSKLKLNLQASISEKINGYIYNVICTKNVIKKDNIIVIPTNLPKMFVVISTKRIDSNNNIYDDLYNDIKEIDFEERYNNDLVKIWIPSFDISTHLFSNKLPGFENIKISDIKYNDEISKHEIQTQEIEAEKPESKRNVDVTIEIKKTTYKEQKPVTTYKEQHKEQKPFNNNTFYSSKVTSSSKGDYSNTYKPKGNKTYVKKEVREEIVEEKKEEIIENNRPKNRTYVREQKEEKVENSEEKGGKKGYFRRRFRGEKEN